MNEPASRKSQSPVEIAANLSMKQKPKQRATAGQHDGQMHQTPLGDTKPQDAPRSLGATAKAEQL